MREKIGEAVREGKITEEEAKAKWKAIEEKGTAKPPDLATTLHFPIGHRLPPFAVLPISDSPQTENVLGQRNHRRTPCYPTPHHQ